MSSLTNLSFAFPHVRAGERASLSRLTRDLDSSLSRSDADTSEVFVLSTCLRVEIAYTGSPEMAKAHLDALLPQHGVPVVPVVRTDGEAFHHLCRVAAGLESPLLGEEEVLGQFRSAAGAISGGEGNGLGRILGKAVGIGRSARRHIAVRPPGSLAFVAAKLALPAERIVVLGAGSMARATVEAIAKDAEVTVFARRPGLVAGHEALPWSRALDGFAGADAVISTVPGDQPLLDPLDLGRALSGRSQPLRVFDLGMPPGFADLGGLEYLGIDDIAGSVPPVRAVGAEKVVMEDAAAQWRKLTAPDEAGRLIAAIIERADAVAEEVAQRFAARLGQADDPAAVLEQVARRVARGVLHRPIAFIGQADSESLETLSEAFGSER